MKAYGASVSYYTGKLETYLRYKDISYHRASPYEDVKEIKQHVGSMQHPIVKRDDGRWMSDSTPMILRLCYMKYVQHSLCNSQPMQKLGSGYEVERKAAFNKAINVFKDRVPS